MSIRKQSAEETQPSWNGQWGMPVTLQIRQRITRRQLKRNEGGCKGGKRKSESRAGKRYSETQGTARGVEKRIEENRKGDTDAISISESGKATLDGKTDSVQIGADNGTSAEETADVIKMEPVIYTKTGEASKSESGMNLSVLV